MGDIIVLADDEGGVERDKFVIKGNLVYDPLKIKR